MRKSYPGGEGDAAARLFRLRTALAAMLLAVIWMAAGVDAVEISVRREGADVLVSNPHYSLAVSPSAGGRITSFVYRGTETTLTTDGGRGGLLAEEHTARRPFAVRELTENDDAVRLVLVCEEREFDLTKRFLFRGDRHWFDVEIEVANRTRAPLAGEPTPALRSLAVPGGEDAAARQFYCMDMGRGSEIHSRESFLAALYGDGQPDRSLRWIAVTDPASRRGLGFAITHGGCAPLLPLRAADTVEFGWRMPTVPAGRKLTSRIRVVPLEGFTAVTELTPQYAAHTGISETEDGLEMSLKLLALESGLKEVSFVSRTFDAEGRELAPLDPLLFEEIEPMQQVSGETQLPDGEARPDWIVQELYSRGSLQGRSAVATAPSLTELSAEIEPQAQPDLEELPGGAPVPGGLIPLSDAMRERGFVVWEFTGVPALSEERELRFDLTSGERRTIFLGLRALKGIEEFRITLAGSGAESGAVQNLPPAAMYTWRVLEEANGGAFLAPFRQTALQQGELVWLALTADAEGLRPGDYACNVVLAGDGTPWEMTCRVTVSDPLADARTAFGLWYAGNGFAGSSMQALREYGVDAATLDIAALAADGALENLAEPHGSAALSLLSLCSRRGLQPPRSAGPEVLLMPEVQPVWLLRANAATPSSVLTCGRYGYRPALVCDHLPMAAARYSLGAGRPRHWLVAGGPSSGTVGALIEDESLAPDDNVWLYMDLRDADWRWAATSVPAAVWAATWQGLAGVAVSCDAPPGTADRQPVVWHIVRDACSDASLWRAALKRARDLARPDADPDARTAALFAASSLEGVIGNSEDCVLTVRETDVGGGLAPRVVPEPGLAAVSIGRFSEARRKTTMAARDLVESVAQTPGQAYWRGVPMIEGNAVKWSIVADVGEQAWKAALALQKGIRERSGYTVQVSRAFPNRVEGSPLNPSIVWVTTANHDMQGLPDAIATALARRPDAPVVAEKLEDGTMVVVLRDDAYLEQLLRTILPRPSFFAPARDVR